MVFRKADAVRVRLLLVSKLYRGWLGAAGFRGRRTGGNALLAWAVGRLTIGRRLVLSWVDITVNSCVLYLTELYVFASDWRVCSSTCCVC